MIERVKKKVRKLMCESITFLTWLKKSITHFIEFEQMILNTGSNDEMIILTKLDISRKFWGGDRIRLQSSCDSNFQEKSRVCVFFMSSERFL